MLLKFATLMGGLSGVEEEAGREKFLVEKKINAVGKLGFSKRIVP